ncbi:hypothetical protein J6590_045581 [Homalodisca vitripennis]|nr:hypothetical protein J6590_045581 [Homalodisca vitripennis]
MSQTCGMSDSQPKQSPDVSSSTREVSSIRLLTLFATSAPRYRDQLAKEDGRSVSVLFLLALNLVLGFLEMCTCVGLLVLGAVAAVLATPLPQREERSASLGELGGLNVAQRKGKNQRYGGGYGGYDGYRPNRGGSGAGSSASSSANTNANTGSHGGGGLSQAQAQAQAQSQSQSHSSNLGLGPFSASISNSQSQAQSNSGAFAKPGAGAFYDY